MNLSSGKTATEEKEVNIRWHQYTEELYRRDPKITDTFPKKYMITSYTRDRGKGCHQTYIKSEIIYYITSESRWRCIYKNTVNSMQ